MGVSEERALGQDPVQGEAGRKEPVGAVKGGQGSSERNVECCGSHSESEEH